MLKWNRKDDVSSIFDKAYFGNNNKITVYKFANEETFKMWLHIDGDWKLQRVLKAKNFEEAHAEAVMIVRDYLRVETEFWTNLFYDLWKAEDWIDEEDDG